MVQKTYIATIQIVIHSNQELESEAQACDWFSGLLTEHEGILDWSYLKVGGQYLYPHERYYDLKNYEEGEAF